MRDFKTAKLFIHLINESLTIYFLRRTHFILLYPPLFFADLPFTKIKPSFSFYCSFVIRHPHPSLFAIRPSSLLPFFAIILSFYCRYILPLLGRSLRIGEYVIGVRILFLSPRNPVFTIFSAVVLQYESTTYAPFLYQSSKIRISFL